MNRWLHLVPGFALAVVASCRDVPTNPGTMDAPDAALYTWSSGTVTDYYDGGPVHGAIFTTTPDGRAVNANVQYTSKLEVYLDGGPRNPNSAAAGLNDGLYVFQVTDPPGKVLLSQDPAKCRVVEVSGGVITRIVRPADLPSPYGPLSNKIGNGASAPDCHVQDDPDGVAGASGRHDWNTDSDPGGGIVVQLMPFLDTPNPGGVYKAWMTPVAVYVANGGSLNTQRPAVTSGKGVKATTIGYAPDPGFGPPRRNIKTDNFKVREAPPSVIVEKYDALTGAALTGWTIEFLDPIDNGYAGGTYTTPTGPIAVPLDTDVTFCEELQDGFQFYQATVNGQVVQAVQRTDIEEGKTHYCVTVRATSGTTTIAIRFYNVGRVVADGRMTGGSGQVQLDDPGRFLSAGFTIHCDILLSNNLQINWKDSAGRSRRWHITKPIRTALCLDTDADPRRPEARFDTFVGTAEGSLDGGPSGSWVEFTFVDAGEPGKGSDLVKLKIWSGAIGSSSLVQTVGGSVCVQVGGGCAQLSELNGLTPIGGNFQAHLDQPHKNR